MDDPRLTLVFEQGLATLRQHGTTALEEETITQGWIADMIGLAISHGVTLYNEGRHDLCHRLYAEAATQVLSAAAQRHNLTDKTRTAVDDLQDALQRRQHLEDPSDAAWWMRHAFDKIMLAQQIHERHAHHLVELGQSAFARSDHKGAIRAYQTATELSRELRGFKSEEAPAAQRIAWLLLGHALFADQNYEASAKALREGMQHVPDWPESGIDIRDQYMRKEEFAAQVSTLGDHLAAEPRDHDARFVYGYVHYFSDEKQQAARVLRHHLQLNPDDRAAQDLLGAAMMAQLT